MEDKNNIYSSTKATKNGEKKKTTKKSNVKKTATWKKVGAAILVCGALVGGAIAISSCDSCACNQKEVSSIVSEANAHSKEVTSMINKVTTFLNRMNTIGINIDTKDAICAYIYLNADSISVTTINEIGITDTMRETQICEGFNRVMVAVKEGYMRAIRTEYAPEYGILIENKVNNTEVAYLKGKIIKYLSRTDAAGQKLAADELNNYIEKVFGSEGTYKELEPGVAVMMMRTIQGVKSQGASAKYGVKVSKSIVTTSTYAECENGIYDKTTYSYVYGKTIRRLREKMSATQVTTGIESLIDEINSKLAITVGTDITIPSIQEVRKMISAVNYNNKTAETNKPASAASMPKTTSSEVTSGKIVIDGKETSLATSSDTRTTFTPEEGFKLNDEGEIEVVSVITIAPAVPTNPEVSQEVTDVTIPEVSQEVTNITTNSEGLGVVSYPEGVTSEDIIVDPTYSSETTSYAEGITFDSEGNMYYYGEKVSVTGMSTGEKIDALNAYKYLLMTISNDPKIYHI